MHVGHGIGMSNGNFKGEPINRERGVFLSSPPSRACYKIYNLVKQGLWMGGQLFLSAIIADLGKDIHTSRRDAT